MSGGEETRSGDGERPCPGLALGLIALLALLAGAYVLVRPGSGGPAWAGTLFVGRFHPLLVHLPIGFLFAVLLLELYQLRQPPGRIGPARALLVGAAAVGSVLSGVAGFCLAREGGYEEEHLWWHQWLGIVTAVLMVGMAAALLFASRVPRWIYPSTLSLCLLATVWAGHEGAELTHGTGYLTEPLWPGKAAGVAKPEYGRDILPVFRTHCTPCHGPTRQEGKLRVDLPEELLEGGESGRPAVVEGDLTASFLVELITLPRDHEKVMPPRERPALTREEMRLILGWIHSGAKGLQKEE